MSKSVKVALACILCSVLIAGYIIYNANTSNKSENTNMQQQGKFATLSVKDFEDKLYSGEYELIDVRTQQEFNLGHIKGAKNIDFYAQDFPQQIAQLDKNKKYLIYCRSGNRSGQTLMLMKQLGFKEVYDLQGGIKNWQSADKPIVK